MDYKHECYDLEKLLLADDEFLLYLLGGENAEALRSDLQIRFNAGIFTCQGLPWARLRDYRCVTRLIFQCMH